MKSKLQRPVMLMALLIGSLFFSSSLFSQTSGTMTFVVNPVSHSGSYGSSHVVAIWIENSTGTFVKTLLRDALTNHTINNHLPVWKANSNLNVVDATTGATLTSYNPITVTWNATNVSAAVVTDGTYNVWVECSWDEGTTGTATTSVAFTKGTSPVTLSPGSTAAFTGMSLTWVPLGVGIADNQKEQAFSISPNPVTSDSKINYSLNDLSDVTIALFDVTGKLVKILVDENQDAGNYSIPLSLTGKLEAGVYLLNFNSGRKQQSSRVYITN